MNTRGVIALLLVVVAFFVGFNGVFASTPGPIDACQELNESGVYTLNASILNFTSPTLSCFNITAENVTLDGAGFNVSGNFLLNTYFATAGSGQTGYGHVNITIQHFPNISRFANGVDLAFTNTSTFYNLTFDGTWNETGFAWNNFNLDSTSNLNNITHITSKNGNGFISNMGNNNTFLNLTFINDTSFIFNIFGGVNGLFRDIVIDHLPRSSEDAIVIAVGTGSRWENLNFSRSNNSFISLSANEHSFENITLSSPGDNAIEIVGDRNNLTNIHVEEFEQTGYGFRSVTGISLINIASGSENNTITNINYTENSTNYTRIIVDASATTDHNYLIYNDSRFGTIKWIDSSFLGNLSFNHSGNATALSFPGLVNINNNSISFNATGFTGNINSSVNITLYNGNWTGFAEAGIRRDGVNCTECVAYTTLTNATVKFNTTGFSTYEIVELTDSSPPTLLMLFPTNATQNYPVNEINFSASDAGGLDSCWYSLNLGVTNVSLASCNVNITGIANATGSLTYNLYANDTLGNLATNSTTFNVDTLILNNASSTPVSPSNNSAIVISANVSSYPSAAVCNLTGDFGSISNSSSGQIIGGVLNYSIGTQTFGSYNYTITCTNGLEEESANYSLTVVPERDLIPQNISFSPAGPFANQNVTITTEILSAEKSSSNVNVLFYDGTSLIGNETISSILADGLASASITHVFDTDGPHTIKVSVNPLQNPLEEDYLNNNYTGSVSVGSGVGGIDVNLTILPNVTEQGNSFDVIGLAVYNFTEFLDLSNGVVVVYFPGDGTNPTEQYNTTTNSTGGFTVTGIKADNIVGNYTINASATDGGTEGWGEANLEINTTSTQSGPNFDVTGYSFSPSNVIAGENVNVSFTVKNFGNENAVLSARIYVAGSQITEQNFSAGVTPGSSVVISEIYNVTNAITYGFEAAADPLELISETDESDNNFSVNLNVYPNTINLAPTSVTFSDTTPYAGQNVTITAKVRNNEGQNSSQFSVEFYNSSGLIESKNISSLAGFGTQTTTSITHVIGSSGNYQINVSINNDGQVTESTLADNNGSGSVNAVSGANPDVTVSAISNSLVDTNGSVIVENNVTINATVVNIGNADSSDTFEVSFYINGSLIDTVNVTELNISQSKTVSTYHVFNQSELGIPKSYTISIDPNELTTEDNEGNNNATANYSLGFPDVSLLGTNIVFNQSNPVENNTIMINATITNNHETANASNISVNFTDLSYSTAIGTLFVDLVANESSVVNHTWSGTTPGGAHVVSVRLNSVLQSYEDDSDNNIATRALAIGDILFPLVTNLRENPGDPYEFTDSRRYEFNATVTDETTLDSVVLIFNGTNYTATNLTTSLYNVTLFNLSIGEYSYTWWARDAGGNVNDTETGTYTINAVNTSTSNTTTGASGSTGGGTSGKNTPVTYVLDCRDGFDSFSRSLKEEDKVEVRLVGETYELEVISAGSGEVDVIFNVLSRTKNIELDTGEKKEFDFDGNGVYEVSLEAENVNTDRATVKIACISVGVQGGEEEAESADSVSFSPDSEDFSSGETNNRRLIIMIIAAAAVLVVVVGGWLFARYLHWSRKWGRRI